MTSRPEIGQALADFGTDQIRTVCADSEDPAAPPRKDPTNMPKTNPTTPPTEEQINLILAAIDQIDVTTIPPERIHVVRKSLTAAQGKLNTLVMKATQIGLSQFKLPEPYRGPVSGLFVTGSDLELVGGDAA